MKKNKLIISIILILGLTLRLYKLKERFVWGTEQSFVLQPIIKLFEEKKLSLIGIQMINIKSALFRPPFYTYIFALPLKIFKFNPLSLGTIFTFLSLITIFFIYLGGKNTFNKKTGLIASFLYAINYFLINTDKNIWVVTPIITISAIIFYLYSKILIKQKTIYFFLSGCLVGLGFSFHFQSIIILTILGILWLIKYGFKKISFFLLGVLLFLSPLIIFNFRHDFIMLKGIKGLFISQELMVKKSQTITGKIGDSLEAFSELVLKMTNLSLATNKLGPNLVILTIFYFLPAFFIIKKGKNKKQKFFSLYFLLSIFLSFIGLTIINPSVYNSFSFYLWFLIPLLISQWSYYLSILFKKNKLITIVFLGLIFTLNFNFIIRQKPSSYQKSLQIVDYVLGRVEKNNLNIEKDKYNIRFINRDALAYNYLFFYRAPFYNLRFSNIQLIEQWQEGKADFFIIHKNYDWQKDKYKIKPYKLLKKINKVTIVQK